MEEYGSNGRKVYSVTESKWLKVFLGSPSQCIYRMFLDFLIHGNGPWCFIVHGIYLWFFYPFSFFRFLTFLGESGDKSQ